MTALRTHPVKVVGGEEEEQPRRDVEVRPAQPLTAWTGETSVVGKENDDGGTCRTTDSSSGDRGRSSVGPIRKGQQRR